MTLSLLFPILILMACSITAVPYGARWIETLYQMYPELLSNPAANTMLKRHRRQLLRILLCLCVIKVTIFSSQPLPAPLSLIAAFFLLLITCTDFEQQVIFDKMLLPFALFAPIAWLWLPLPYTDYLLAAFAGGICFLLFAFLTHGGIGGGDIKLIFVLGLWLGPHLLLQTICIGLLFGGAAALILLLTKRKTAHSYFAYGPYFAISALFYLL